MKIKAELLPLIGKYYGSEIEITGEEGYEGRIKVWLPYLEYNREAISKRELDNIEIFEGEDPEEVFENSLPDWDYSHSENKLTHEVCLAIVEALNGKEL